MFTLALIIFLISLAVIALCYTTCSDIFQAKVPLMRIALIAGIAVSLQSAIAPEAHHWVWAVIWSFFAVVSLGITAYVGLYGRRERPTTDPSN